MEYHGSHVIDISDKPPFVKPRFFNRWQWCVHTICGRPLGLDGVYYSAIDGHTEHIHHDKSPSIDVVARPGQIQYSYFLDECFLGEGDARPAAAAAATVHSSFVISFCCCYYYYYHRRR